jgi:multimeric flavodoxin WrbA
MHPLSVVAFNGSPRKDGNTALMMRAALRELETHGVRTELVHIGGTMIRGCTACYQCWKTKDKHCAIKTDMVNDCIARMLAADGIILGSPTYFADITAEMKALIDRAGMTSRANGDMFKRKAGAAAVAVRRAGAIHAFDSINHFFTIGQMIVVGSSYWNIGIGREIGEVERDEEGMNTMVTLGQNMAWLLQKLHG